MLFIDVSLWYFSFLEVPFFFLLLTDPKLFSNCLHFLWKHPISPAPWSLSWRLLAWSSLTSLLSPPVTSLYSHPAILLASCLCRIPFPICHWTSFLVYFLLWAKASSFLWKSCPSPTNPTTNMSRSACGAVRETTDQRNCQVPPQRKRSMYDRTYGKDKA